jgi:predicted DNA-binding WGR domain protein
MVIRTFGSVKHSIPTRVITTIYPEKIDAQTAYEALIRKKEQKGYRP